MVSAIQSMSLAIACVAIISEWLGNEEWKKQSDGSISEFTATTASGFTGAEQLSMVDRGQSTIDIGLITSQIIEICAVVGVVAALFCTLAPGMPEEDGVHYKSEKFTDYSGAGNLSEVCTCYGSKEPHRPFEKAWKAIEDGETFPLKQAIQEMKESEAGSSAPLDTCRLMEKSGVAYSMNLLALCGFHGRKEMVDLLLKEGADMKAGCACKVHTGTPIIQMMLHCLIQGKYDNLSVSILEYFIEKGAKLNGMAFLQLDRGGVNYGLLDPPLLMKRIDCAKVIMKAGVDLVSGGCPEAEKFDVVPMFQEYHYHGTNEFIHWAFNEYIPQHPEIDLERFAQRIIQSISNMKEQDKEHHFWKPMQRSPAHAVLTSHHEGTIKRLVQCSKENGLDLLAERSCTGKTALHVAAENGDVESVQILLQLGAGTRAIDNSSKKTLDNSGMNPFMLAVDKGHWEVVKFMMKEEPGLVSLSVGSVAHWNLGKDHYVFYKDWIEENPEALLMAKDFQGNTIAHMVAASGNTEVFEILWSKQFADAVFSDKNSEGKTPLDLAVGRGHVNILRTFQSLVDGGKEVTAPQWHRELMKTWSSKVESYFLLASSCGSLDAVEYFIDNGQKPNLSHDGKTPLLCAAEAGHDEIVAYLLKFRKVQNDQQIHKKEVHSSRKSPLLMAARNGHTKCVTLLLEKGANVNQRDSEGRNCLTIAIQNHHKDTALAILSDKNGMEDLNGHKNPNPLQLLIKEMPDLAEYVLNKCITQDEPGTDKPKICYNFKYLKTKNFEDLKDKDRKVSHVLNWMIEHNRLELLQHPLVENFLFQKFWLKTFPLLLLNLLFYCIFLIALNWFAVKLPRPEPASEACSDSDDVAFSGQNQDALVVTANLLICLSYLGLFGESLQLIDRSWRYFKDFDNCLQLALYISTVIFIHGFDNECWCSTFWQWQIGAFAVFLSWLNVILVLKYMPFTAIPINMFLSICVKFLNMIYLPLLLLLAFGVPHYMVFVRTKKQESLPAFRSPSHAVAKTLLQLAGEFDFEDTFNRGDLLYTPTTYILFITFLITMPILFINLLNALAVGETQEITKNAEFTSLELRVVLIQERWRMKGLLLLPKLLQMKQLLFILKQWKRKQLHMHSKSTYTSSDDLSHLSQDPENTSPFIVFVLKLLGRDYCPQNRFVTFVLKVLGKDYAHHAKIAKKLKKQTEEIYSTVMAQNPIKEDITKLKEDIKQEMMAKKPVREDITESKEDISAFKQEMMAKKPVREDITGLREDISTFKQEMMALVKPVDEMRDDITKLKEDMAQLIKALTPARKINFDDSHGS